RQRGEIDSVSEAELTASASARERSSDARDSLIQVLAVDLAPHEVDAQGRGRQGRVAQAEERIEEDLRPLEAVKADAVLGDTGREGRRVRAVLVAVLDRLVGDEPGVAAAAAVAGGGAPAADVGLVLVLHADGAAIEGGGARRREVDKVIWAALCEWV